jgi:cell division protein FtsB
VNGLPLPIVRLAVVACVPLALLFALSFARIVVADYAIHQQKAALESRISALKQENLRLKRRIGYLNTDAGVELLAREELGWVRPGETAVVILPPPPELTTRSSVTPTPRR